MKQFFLLAAIICFGMAAIKFCTARMKPNSPPITPQSASKDTGVLTAEEAKQRMDENSEAIVLDVRTQEEFDQGHIPGAVCLPNEFIAADMPFPFGKDTELLLYCRSGRRSAEAAKKLRELGFSNVFDFGGIIDWPYDITTE
ncbi:rhodanese-like domain-containing protein [Dysosmobacter sp.]|uniref:rhodanese-like domain-containing protein n=1 Tax=Dysosmobacter sp. TaxID=2591382 RepID=UPI002A9F2B23|nr:rhodanese-like domain-containing protein [Dysosmobacter sp.]MDY5612278.1 rhodanese-like domain-containing protein [Dysosmobacter sp.]